MVRKAQGVTLALKVKTGLEAIPVFKVLLALRVRRESKEFKVILALMVKRVIQVLLGKQERQVTLVKMVLLELLGKTV
jgi:hypothetical protein